MISVNGAYLINILERYINKTISIRRSNTSEEFNAYSKQDAANEEKSAAKAVAKEEKVAGLAAAFARGRARD